jgi:hypothetical protein
MLEVRMCVMAEVEWKCFLMNFYHVMVKQLQLKRFLEINFSLLLVLLVVLIGVLWVGRIKLVLNRNVWCIFKATNRSLLCGQLLIN